MQKLLIRTLGMALLATASAGCGLVYTPDVQQGNLLDKKNVDQLQPGMTKRQVLVLMGTPSVISPFDNDRWDYVSTFSHRAKPITTRTPTPTSTSPRQSPPTTAAARRSAALPLRSRSARLPRR